MDQQTGTALVGSLGGELADVLWSRGAEEGAEKGFEIVED